MENIDQLTLELLMNKTNYYKYIEKTDEKKYKEREEYIKNVKKYKLRILEITQRYLEDPDLQISLEMNDMFSDYCKTCIKHFQIKTFENSFNKNDEEVLFDPEQME